VPFFHFEISNNITPHLNGVAAVLPERLRLGVNKQLYRLQAVMRTEKLSGQVLKVRTGNLRNAVVVLPATAGADTIEGVVGLGKEAWYGKFHEFGGTFIGAVKKLKRPPHMATRKRGERVMTGSPYGIYFPARPWFRVTFREQRDRVINELRAELSHALVSGREG
jgi:phage gpG-like protein